MQPNQSDNKDADRNALTQITASPYPTLQSIDKRPKRHLNRRLIIGTGISVTTAIILGVFYLSSAAPGQPQKTTISNSSAGVVVSQKQSVPAKPGGWIVFSSAKYGISFYAPSSWRVQEQDFSSIGKYTVKINGSEYQDEGLRIGVELRKDLDTLNDGASLTDSYKQTYSRTPYYKFIEPIVPTSWRGHEARRIHLEVTSPITKQVHKTTELQVKVGNYVYTVPDVGTVPYQLNAKKISENDWLQFANSVQIKE